jgi:alpha-glucosidase
MPWNDPDRVLADLREDYAGLAALRRDQPALTGGGLRWLYAHGDALAFVRETAASSVLVVVARAAAEVELPAGMLTDAQFGALAEVPAFAAGHVSTGLTHAGLENAGLDNSGQIRADGGASGALICTRGPAAGVWVLPGTPLPGATLPGATP